MKTEKIKVMIVDDMVSLCRKYEAVFAQEEELEVVAVAHDGYQAIMKSAVTRPDVILMDIEMESKYAGIAATRQILQEFPAIKIVILTVYEEDEMIYAAFQAGACDYILKTASAAAMVQCVKDAYYEKSILRPQVAKKLRREFKRIKNNEDTLLYTIYLVQLLTDTERDILSALHEGKGAKDICRERFIEPATLKTHIRNIVKKMKCRSIEDVVDKVEQSGFFYYMDKIREKTKDML
ncbi:MAG: response regulator transcription factor [Lachnospiraceae bacterium]|nr:response regulator transcription factor [Lachnospiraceae bacterium]